MLKLIYTRSFLFILCGLFCIGLSAQDGLKIGQWRSHLPYQFGRYITQSTDQVFFTTDWAVMAIDKQERSVEYISKVNRLSNAGTEFVKYDPISQSLLVTYSNSDFDLLTENDGTLTFSNIRTDGNFFNRQINDVALASNNRFYFTTSFGVVEFDPARREFGFTADLGTDIYGISLYQDFFYAASADGIYRAPNDPAINLKDISNWKLLGSEAGLPDDYISQAVVSYENNLYASIDEEVYRFDGSDWTFFYSLDGYDARYLTAEGKHLMVGMYCLDNCTGQVALFDGSGFVGFSGRACTDRPLYAIEDQYGQGWFADQFRDYRVSVDILTSCDRLRFNSPFSHFATDIVAANGVTYVATEPTRVKPVFYKDGFFRLQDGQWTTFSQRFNDILKEFGMQAFYRLAIHPTNGKVYAGTFYRGMVELDGDDLRVFNAANSNLQRSSLDTDVTRISGLAFDSEENLWIANHTAPNSVAVMLNGDGEIKNDFNLPSILALRQVIVDDFDNKWFTIDGDQQGILVFNEGVMDDPSDDQYRFITAANSQLTNNRVNCLTVDLDGDVWVGTEEGAFVFECGSNVLDASLCQGSRRIVEVGGFNAYLLEDENVLTIAVDGANRKWFGTESGVFVQSPDGEEQIAFYNDENSPLFDNIVLDIAIDDQTGEVFIGTAKGLISLKGEATRGELFNAAQIYAYPNPVRPDYEGPIAIKGLARNADVKITDISGQLVFETKALGGQAIWDGRDYNGRKANSGVYLVYSTAPTSLDKPDAVVTKILLMN